jgi:hypothetical protein
VEAADLLNEKARDYEVLAASHTERAPLGVRRGEHLAAASAFIVVAIVLREVADTLEEAA